MNYFILILSLLALNIQAEEQDEKYQDIEAQVVAIEDGDTVIIQHDYHLMRLQLEDIDAPEIKRNPKFQYDLKRTGLSAKELRRLGRLAKTYLKQMVLSKTVKAHIHQEQDKYGRHLAELFIGGQSVNRLLVSSGYAQPLGKRWLEDYQRAKSEHLGLWQEPFRSMMEAWAEEKIQ